MVWMTINCMPCFDPSTHGFSTASAKFLGEWNCSTLKGYSLCVSFALDISFDRTRHHSRFHQIQNPKVWQSSSRHGNWWTSEVPWLEGLLCFKWLIMIPSSTITGPCWCWQNMINIHKHQIVCQRCVHQSPLSHCSPAVKEWSWQLGP